MDEIRRPSEHAVSAAARSERRAWAALQRVNGPDADESAVRSHRERWQAAASSLVEALRALKIRSDITPR